MAARRQHNIYFAKVPKGKVTATEEVKRFAKIIADVKGFDTDDPNRVYESILDITLIVGTFLWIRFRDDPKKSITLSCQNAPDFPGSREFNNMGYATSKFETAARYL
jgi:hypothetical protein